MRTLGLVSTAVTLVVTTTLTMPAEAQAFFGFGTKSCGAWTQERRAGDATTGSLAYTSWLLGFVSGTNVEVVLGLDQSDFLASTDAPALVAFVDNYCSGHPLDTVMDGASALVAALRKKAHEDAPNSK
jgi:hypothetical protein